MGFYGLHLKPGELMPRNWIFTSLIILGMHFGLDASPNQYNLPLYFEQNEGQIDASVKYFTHNSPCSLYFTPEEVLMVVPGAELTNVLKLKFIGANEPSLVGLDLQSHKSNHFKGTDSSQWLTNVPNFAKVCYQNV